MLDYFRRNVTGCEFVSGNRHGIGWFERPAGSPFGPLHRGNADAEVLCDIHPTPPLGPKLDHPRPHLSPLDTRDLVRTGYTAGLPIALTTTAVALRSIDDMQQAPL